MQFVHVMAMTTMGTSFVWNSHGEEEAVVVAAGEEGAKAEGLVPGQ